MKFVKDYMENETLRHELNELTLETFGFSFEDWVRGGYYEGDYIPFSYEEDGHLIANVSANRMDFLQNNEVKHYIQLGTVMTKATHRNRGLASRLLKEVLAEFEGKCDGIYLYGNLDALGFYDKMGFLRGMQYRYTLKEDVRQKFKGKTLDTEGFLPVKKEHKQVYQTAVRTSAVHSAFEQMNKYGLQMFYTADLEQVYYSKELDCYLVKERMGDTLFIHSVIAERKISMEQILLHISEDYQKLILGFTPCQDENELFEAEIYDGEEDYRLFYIGDDLKEIESQKLYFPTFSHA